MASNSSNNQNAHMSKRQLLQSIGMIGGSAAVFATLQGWNLAHASASKAPPKLSTEGKGKKIVILGAGLSGMIIALEMSKKGYDCQILEAQSYIGGRCQSARKGDVIHELEGEKQVCNYTDGQYFNYGPWRIPAQHHPTLHYCHTLGVKLEPLMNKSPMAYYMTEKDGPYKNKPIRQGELDVDRMGHVSELLAKCADQGKLDDMITMEDKERLLEYLRNQGLIDKKTLDYRANRVRGYKEYPGAGFKYGEFSDILDLQDTFKFDVAEKLENEDHPVTMFQPVGGMDRLAHAIHDALPRNTVKLNSEVSNIHHADDGVTVTYTDTNTGKTETVKGDYCVSCIPFPVVSKISHNFGKEVTDGIKAPAGVPAFKQGLQFDRRFWEQDDMIYGGGSITDIPGHSVTAYPSSDLHSNLPGVVLGSYIWGGEAARISNLSIKDRVEFALDVGERIHPGNYRKHYNGNAMTIAWHRHKYQLGGWVMWTARKRRRHLQNVLDGEKRMLFTGNGISTIHTGWMVGAIEAAWHTLADLDKRIAKQA